MRLSFWFGGVLAFLLGLAVTLGAGSEPLADTRSACSRHIPSGRDARAAEQVLELFFRTTIVAAEPACGSELMTGTAGSVPPFRTRHPGRAGGWFQLAPLVRNDDGRLEYAAFLYLHAPDAEPAAFELLLELHGRWLVSHVAPAPGSAKPDLSILPT